MTCPSPPTPHTSHTHKHTHTHTHERTHTATHTHTHRSQADMPTHQAGEGERGGEARNRTQDRKVFFHFTEPTVTDCDVNKSRTINPSGSAALVCGGGGTGPVNLFPRPLFLLYDNQREQERLRGRTERVSQSHSPKNRLLQRTKESEY